MADTRRRAPPACLLLAGLVAMAAVVAAPARAADDPAPVAAAAPGESVYLEELTSPELARRVQRGDTIALVPIGGTEQSGGLLTLGKHNARVRVLAGRIAQAAGHAIVAPVIAYVPEGSIQPPTGHMRFPGTISIPDAAFESMLEGTARSLRQAGFRDVFFLGDHGGYQSLMDRVAARLAKEPARPGAPPFHVHALDTYYRVVQTAYVDALKQRGHAPAEIGEHAGLADTSLSMALAPETVRAASVPTAPARQPGVTGDPRRSTVALGQVGATLIVEQSVAALRAAVGRP